MAFSGGIESGVGGGTIVVGSFVYIGGASSGTSCKEYRYVRKGYVDITKYGSTGEVKWDAYLGRL